MQFKDYKGASNFLREVDLFTRTYVAQHAGEVDSSGAFPSDIVPQIAGRRLFAFDRLTEGGRPFRCAPDAS